MRLRHRSIYHEEFEELINGSFIIIYENHTQNHIVEKYEQWT